ncbi:polyadenylate-binding protein 6-like [Anopheles arabiensis]|uniref:polyadenylate-binding protein 6-like n=1 Tax=Anopheles arabiensis TaxID=7173 RepID=UPI001AACBE87|nr:polyadenylate-binding protein 6-like [Anopheles arabiensis]XP_040173007.1 polyadenylate-binding protein 6-like [Anopheles arabiensis]
MERKATLTHVYVGNLAPNVNDQLLRRYLSMAGTVVSTKIARNAMTGESLLYGSAVFATTRDVQNVIRRLNGKVFHDKPLLVCSYGDCSSELHHYQRTVVIGNKEQYLTHSAICKRFAPYGRVLLCMQPKIRHRPSNAVFVLLESAEVASLVMKTRHGCWFVKPYRERMKQVRWGMETSELEPKRNPSHGATSSERKVRGARSDDPRPSQAVVPKLNVATRQQAGRFGRKASKAPGIEDDDAVFKIFGNLVLNDDVFQ